MSGTGSGTGEDVRQFIYEYIDSVEQLEVLLYLRHHAGDAFTADQVSGVMRSNPHSVASRMRTLEAQGLIASSGDAGYLYPKDSSFDDVIAHVEESYRLRPHKMMELIFSPMKKARGFAEAFVVKRKKTEDPNG